MYKTILTKLQYWLDYTQNCIQTKNSFLTPAQELSKLSEVLLNSIQYSDREDLETGRLHNVFPYILGLYSTSNSFHKTIQILVTSGHGQNAMLMLRPQLESLLILLYLTEPQENIEEIEKRIEKFLDWTMIKMYQNSEQSSNLDFVRILSTHKEFSNFTQENYQKVCAKYFDRPKELKKLINSSSFLENKAILAEKYQIKDLYHHIHAESSGNLHMADISDRVIQKIYDNGIEYVLNPHIKDGFWALMMSNLLQFYLLANFSTFLKIKNMIIPKLEVIFKVK